MPEKKKQVLKQVPYHSQHKILLIKLGFGANKKVDYPLIPEFFEFELNRISRRNLTIRCRGGRLCLHLFAPDTNHRLNYRGGSLDCKTLLITRRFDSGAHFIIPGSKVAAAGPRVYH